MADLYVRSGGDVGAWTGTYASVALAAAADNAGDNVYVASDHAESLTAAQAWAFAGTAAAPVKVICSTTAAAPPTAVSTAGTCATTGASYNYTVSGYCFVYGLDVSVSGAVNANIILGVDTTEQTYEACSLRIAATGTNANITIGAPSNTLPVRCVWNDVDIALGNANGSVVLNMGSLEWNGGTVLASPDLTLGLIRPSSAGEYLQARVNSVDATEVGVTGYLVGKGAGSRVDVVFRNCKIPAFTTGGLYTGTLQAGDRIEMYNCDSGDTNYRLWIETQWGSTVSDTSVYNDAGVDTTGIGSSTTDIAGFSWKMASSGTTKFPHQLLVSPEIVKWNETVTGTLTATVEIVHNSQGNGTSGALLDSEIWLEVMCMDPGGTPVGKWQSDRCANLNLNSNAADQASSTATWTGDAAGWDTQKLVVSFTPKEKGYVHARVCLALASKTVYVDPLLTIA